MAEVVEVRPDELDQPTEDQTEVEEETTETDDVEIEVEAEKAKPEGDDLSKRVRDLETQLYEAGRTIQKLQEKPAEKPLPPKVKEEAGERLSDEQLVAVIKEHSENPEVLVRVMKYMAETQAKDIASSIRDETLKDVNYSQWFSQHKQINDSLMSEYYSARPELKTSVKPMVENLGLANHPLGEIAVFGIMKLAEEAKSKEAVEATRTKDINTKKGLEKTRSSSDKSPTAKLTSDQLKVAAKLGVDPKTYAKFVKDDAAAVS